MKNIDDAIEVAQLTVNYDKTPILWDLQFAIPKGALVGVIGPNGAGKSTLIKTALGIVKPLSGKVSFFGASIDTQRQHIAYVPQRETVDWDFPITVRQLVMMGRYGKMGIFRWPRKADYASVDHYLEKVGLSAFADRQISQLSGGQQQRAFIARALVQEAEIYLMDEPFAGVDLATEKAMMDLFRGLIAEGKTILIVHHNLNTVVDYFDWVVLLNMRLVACGPRDEVFTPENLNIAYGKSHALFDEAVRLSQKKSTGLER
ncbi:MAG: ABC transporter ATP-binding protein [Chlamydiales bacterium]|nr:ABC transporter ATP-binding protein [Chlamydiia bacterium]MCP5507714.1 ABC transporter ATP-binding protein [Chlamydiales bacterium]